MVTKGCYRAPCFEYLASRYPLAMPVQAHFGCTLEPSDLFLLWRLPPRPCEIVAFDLSHLRMCIGIH